MWMWKDYSRVQKWHRTHNRHHLEYAGNKSYDFEAMVIDWECSRFTKLNSPLKVREEVNKKINEEQKPFLIKNSILNF